MNFNIPKDEWTGEAAFILGGGPSIKNFDFDRLRGRGRVIAVNNAYTRAPWADVLFWADSRWLEWNAHDIKRHTGKYKLTRRKPHVDIGCHADTLHYIPNRFSYWQDSVGGWCGGSNAINIAYLFGARVIILLGFDMREQPVMNWHNLHMMPHEPNQHRKKFIPALEMMETHLTKANVTVINTNERSGLRCFPFANIEELLSMDDVAKVEREKYLQVWQRPEYRRVSPGMMETDRAVAVCGISQGDSLIDFGSGPCRASNWFINRGVSVTAIDFAPNASEFKHVPFVEACLWDDDLPTKVSKADFGFCTDVMEHIPGDKIDKVLSNIAIMTKLSVYFRIATRPDRMGPRLIQKPLHMTVEQPAFWREKLENHFATVDVVEQTDRDIMLVARP